MAKSEFLLQSAHNVHHHTIHIAMYMLHYEHLTLLNANCSMQIALRTLHYACIIHYACALHYVHCIALSYHYAHFDYTMRIALCTLHYAYCTILFTLHYQLCALHYMHCAMCIVLYSLYHYAHSTFNIALFCIHITFCKIR